MIRSSRHFIILVVITVVVVGVLMAPRRNEWFAIMRDDDKQAQLIEQLESRLAHDPNDPDLLATLARSYAELHNNQRAAELLLRYIAVRPDDGEAYAQLADTYKNMSDQTRRIAMLQRSLSLKPSLSRAKELAELYRDNRQTDSELALLSQYELKMTLQSGLLLRLAQLHVAHGEQDAALRVLMRPEILTASNRQPALGQDERLYLASLLSDAGRSAEAVRLGKQWILQWHEPWLADKLLRNVVRYAPVADASELAEAVAVLHPELRFFLVNELAKVGAPQVAERLLATWSQANPSPSLNELAAFLGACRALNEPGIVWQAFAGVLSRHAPDGVVTRYSQAIAAVFGIGSLAPFWPYLPQSIYQSSPLLAAQLAFQEHDLALTRRLLDRVDLSVALSADRRMWLELLTAVAQPAEVVAALHNRQLRGSLPRELMAKYAVMAGELGLDTEYRAALTDLRHVSP